MQISTTPWKRVEQVALELLKAGADANCAEAEDGWTALMAACFNGRADVAKRLLDAGANVRTVDKDGWTAILYAVDSSSHSAAQ